MFGFKRLFTAIMTAAVAFEELATSVTEANSRFRANVLEGAETPQLEHSNGTSGSKAKPTAKR